MPTIITHGIVAFAFAAKARGLPALNRGALLLACAACAMLPDLDVIGFQLHVQYNSLFGHRGFTHSFFFAAVTGLVVAWLFHRRSKGSAADFAKLFPLFFAVTASHPLLDAMTDGGEGVALFSPFSNHRYFFPYRPIMVAPLGVGAFFGLRGLLVLVDELLLVIAPLAILLYLPELRRLAAARKAAALAMIVAWALLLSALKGLYPLNNVGMTIHGGDHPLVDLFTKQYHNPHLLDYVPTAGIPDGKLVTSFGEFQKRGLFNRRLETSGVDAHWASGFWPNWFGGIAGRWQDPNYQLVLRTFFGYGVPDGREIRDVLRESVTSPAKRDYLFHLSPTEKYDLALGDYGFTSTKSILAVTHNASELPKYWFGICNGMAAAAKWYEEPFRAVDVINPNGFRVRFHPNDVKALLGYALANAAQWTEVGTRCAVNGPEARACRVNPGAFFLAAMNRIALAHDAFIVDGFSGTRKQFYLFDALRLEVLKAPRPVVEMRDWAVPTPVKYLTEVRFTMDFVSTLLSDKAGREPADDTNAEGTFRKVGRVVVPRVLDAELALDENGEVIGGAWLGDTDVPDVIFFPGPTPALDKEERLQINSAFSWPTIKQIYYKSVSVEKELKAIDLSL